MSGLNWHDAVSAWAAIVTYPSEGWALAPDMSGAAGDQDRHARGGRSYCEIVAAFAHRNMAQNNRF